ncbi:MAG: hypothetical protein ACUZ8E_12515 [Candidatus Anammoxibacter sp.]
MKDQAEILKSSLTELGKLLKMQEKILNNALKNIPKDQQKKYNKMVNDAKAGKISFSDMQNILNDNNIKS